MAKQKFGGKHTIVKLEKLEAYLRAYTIALSKQSFRLVFFDALAGTGNIKISDKDKTQYNLFAADEYEQFISGSARRALTLEHPFDQYIFVEKFKRKTRDLAKLESDFSQLADRIIIKRGDCNGELKQFCANTDWDSTRAVVFLDPFGNQINWITIQEIAKTKAIDLWYLFPAGLGVHRQIKKDGTIHFTHGNSLDALFGTPNWRHAFVEEKEDQGLLGLMKTTTKIATPDSITRYMIGRMKEEFIGGVLNEWLPLGSKGVHMYSLLFAWANPSPKAKLAGTLAQAVLRSGANGRT